MPCKNLILMAAIITLSGCTTAQQHRQAVQDDATDKVTVGTVQRSIHEGMSGAEVAAVLGSPNIVTTDKVDGVRQETWIYDKIATDRVYSASSGGVNALFLGFGGNAAGGVLPSVSQSAGASSTSQRTLTIIVKFNGEGQVRDFAYHTSRF